MMAPRPSKTAKHSSQETAHARRVDPLETAQFAQHAKDWWDPQGSMAMLHEINPTRMGYIRQMLSKPQPQEKPLKGLRICDLGCGAGLVSLALSRLGADVTGLDATAALILAGQQQARTEGLPVTFLHMTSDQLAAEGTVFDHLVCLEMLEHVPDPQSIIDDAAALLRPGGTAIFSTLNRTTKSFFGGILFAEYLAGWVPRGTHQWRRFIKPDELIEMTKKAGFQAKDVTGMSYDPLRGIFHLSDDQSINYFLTVEKQT